MELKNLKINFLGDSITQGCGASSVEKRYTDLIASKYGAIVKNYGIGGTRIAVQTNEFSYLPHNADFVTRVDQMDDDADLVIVFGGTNDYEHGDAPVGTFDDRDPYTFYGALHTLCQKLLLKYPSSRIAFITPLHRCNEFTVYPDKDGNPKRTLKEYVEIIREITEYYSIGIIDLYRTSQIQPNIEENKVMFMPDGLHPNDAGYEILTDRITSYIKAL